MSRKTKKPILWPRHRYTGSSALTNQIQTNLLRQLSCWLKSKQFHIKEDLSLGLCAGLASLWLYYVARQKEAYFFKLMSTIINWDGISNEDAIFNEFLNAVIFLQSPEEVLGRISQCNLSEKLNFIMPEHIRVKAPEFQFSLLFQLYELKQFLTKIMPKFAQKMIYISSGEHMVGLYFENPRGPYQFYDPAIPTQVNQVISLQQLVDLLRERLMPRVQEKFEPWLALSFNVIDFTDRPLMAFSDEDYEFPSISSLAELKQLVNRQNPEQAVTALELAVQFNQTKMVDKLLKAGCDPNTGLWIAACEGNEYLFKQLLDAGADPTCLTQKKTALFYATYFKKNNIMQYLIGNERVLMPTLLDAIVTGQDEVSQALFLYCTPAQKAKLSSALFQQLYMDTKCLVQNDTSTLQKRQHFMDYLNDISPYLASYEKTRLSQEIKLNTHHIFDFLYEKPSQDPSDHHWHMRFFDSHLTGGPGLEFVLSYLR